MRRYSLVLALIWVWTTGITHSQQPASPIRETHGERQVRRMLEDRFFMSAFPIETGGMRSLSPDDSIVQWAVAQFESTPTGGMVFWNSDLPKSPPSFLADHASPSKSSLGFINLAKVFPNGPSKGEYIDFEHLWMFAVFELLNIQQTEDWNKLDQRVAKENLAKNQYIEEAARIEFGVLHKLMQFYKETWVPWAKSANFKSDSTIWRLDTPTEFQDWIKLYREQTGYPWIPFGERYEFFKKRSNP